jgi:predicted ester cyclase
MSTQRENTAVALRLYQAFDDGALNEVGELIDANFVAEVLGTTTLDWSGFSEFGAAFRRAFPDGRHVFDSIVADGENVVTVGTYRGVHAEEIQGLRPTGRKLELPVMHVDRVVGGKIVEHRGLANELDFMRQLGVVLVPDKPT